MKAAKGKKKYDVVKDLEKNVDLISEPKTKEKIQVKKIQKEEAKKKKISEKLRNRNKKKMDEEKGSDDGEFEDLEDGGMVVE